MGDSLKNEAISRGWSSGAESQRYWEVWLGGLVEPGGCVKAGVGLPSTAVAGASLVTVVEGIGTELPSGSHWHLAFFKLP